MFKFRNGVFLYKVKNEFCLFNSYTLKKAYITPEELAQLNMLIASNITTNKELEKSLIEAGFITSNSNENKSRHDTPNTVKGFETLLLVLTEECNYPAQYALLIKKILIRI